MQQQLGMTMCVIAHIRTGMYGDSSSLPKIP